LHGSGKVFVRGGWERAAGVASMRRYQKLSPCQVEPVSVSSKTDPPLAKSRSTRNVGERSEMM